MTCVREENMKTKRLGKTDLQVSEVGFGGIPIIPLSTPEAVAVVRHCLDLGFNFFDTANMYRDSEEKLGIALAPVRDKIIIATKTGCRDAEGAAAHLDLSLERLRTDRIDLFQLHNVSNPETLEQVLAPGGAYEALDLARRAGKIRFIGISSHNIDTAMAALQSGRFETLQFPFNFIENDPADALFPLAQKNDIGIIGMKPLGGGLLERADLCFKFLQQHPGVVPIPGIKSASEADEIVALYREPVALRPVDHAAIAAILNDLGAQFCHRCEYCMPCPQEVQIPSVLIFKGVIKRISVEGARDWLTGAMESVAECIECGECEQKCPYELPIPDLLKENLALFNAYVQEN